MQKIFIVILVFLIVQFNVVYASQYSSQDIFLISKIEIRHKNEPLDLLEKIKSEIINRSDVQYTFPGGAIFTNSSNYHSGKVLDYYCTILANSSVLIGVFEIENETCLAIIVTPDIDQKKTNNRLERYNRY